jgi:hypothetical protein
MPAVDSAPPIPTPDHTIAQDPQTLGVVGCYDELLAIYRRQVSALRINYEMLDIAAGFNVGYASKLLAHSEHNSSGSRRTKRHFSPESFDAYLQALGLKLVAVQDPERVARIATFLEGKLLKRQGPVRAVGTEPPVVIKLAHSHIKRIARLGGIARAEKLHAAALAKKQRSEINRRNALKRWRRAQVTSDRQEEPGPSDQPPA